MENRKINPKIVFLGTPVFGAVVLKKLALKYEPSLVVTIPDKKSGRKQKLRPSPVKEAAEGLDLPLLQTENNSEIISRVEEIKPDLLISAAWGKILPEDILKRASQGALNVHPSLLPEYRGCSPIQAAILNGNKKTGVTIILMNKELDQGDIITQEEYPLKGDETYDELSKELANLGADLLIEAIPTWLEGKISPRPQKGESSFVHDIKKEDGRIDWNLPAETIERQVRAFYPWPGAFTFWERNGNLVRLKIAKTEVKNLKKDFPPGTVFSPPELAVKCKQKSLQIKRLQPEGKKEMKVEDFLRGNSEILNDRLF